MQDLPLERRKLPYSCPVLCVSLGGASLLLLLIYLCFGLGYLSAETAIWLAIGVFVLAAAYESSLVFIMTRHMIGKISGKPPAVSTPGNERSRGD